MILMCFYLFIGLIGLLVSQRIDFLTLFFLLGAIICIGVLCSNIIAIVISLLFYAIIPLLELGNLFLRSIGDPHYRSLSFSAYLDFSLIFFLGYIFFHIQYIFKYFRKSKTDFRKG